MKEHKIDEVVNIKLKVVESEGGCGGCYFYYVANNGCKIKCLPRERTDNKSIKYIEIKEEE